MKASDSEPSGLLDKERQFPEGFSIPMVSSLTSPLNCFHHHFPSQVHPPNASTRHIRIVFRFLLGCKTLKENMKNSYQLLQVAKMQKDEALPQRNEAYYRHGTAASSMRVSIPTAATAGGFRFQAVASRKPTVSTREPTINPIHLEK